MNIKNAIIENVSITIEQECLTIVINLYFGTFNQGFGGYGLYSNTNKKISSNMGYFMCRIMEITGISNWDDLKGKVVRVQFEDDKWNSNIIAIGHIIEDIWFNPKEELK